MRSLDVWSIFVFGRETTMASRGVLATPQEDHDVGFVLLFLFIGEGADVYALGGVGRDREGGLVF
ncbi:hypothetical protein KSX_54630 [Ktedonospora formicarum]|uniref:Uncharacterized protein n=1 Tax=Ktedonospora formicarum TaxID=2778364 RepID=A0A8J3MW84_9CHLR|nr:hypothetical protein KSX_54630 [Ktedonospora formicarum]